MEVAAGASDVGALQLVAEARQRGECVMVYCGAVDQVHRFAKDLRRLGSGETVLEVTGESTARERENAAMLFSCKLAHVVVATSAFGCGIHRSDVRLVLLLGCYSVLEVVQLAGRGGRDGTPQSPPPPGPTGTSVCCQNFMLCMCVCARQASHAEW